MHGLLPRNFEGKPMNIEQSYRCLKSGVRQGRNRKYNSGSSKPSN